MYVRGPRSGVSQGFGTQLRGDPSSGAVTLLRLRVATCTDLYRFVESDGLDRRAFRIVHDAVVPRGNRAHAPTAGLVGDGVRAPVGFLIRQNEPALVARGGRQRPPQGDPSGQDFPSVRRAIRPGEVCPRLALRLGRGILGQLSAASRSSMRAWKAAGVRCETSEIGSAASRLMYVDQLGPRLELHAGQLRLCSWRA